VLWARVCEIDDLMTAACAGSDDLGSRLLFVDFAEQIGGDLN